MIQSDMIQSDMGRLDDVKFNDKSDVVEFKFKEESKEESPEVIISQQIKINYDLLQQLLQQNAVLTVILLKIAEVMKIDLMALTNNIAQNMKKKVEKKDS